ncbi:MAG: acyltransferase [Deltaproteobacteria bacterium]|nr:acyltransferase [Deltaproteobacteria bacterium]
MTGAIRTAAGDAERRPIGVAVSLPYVPELESLRGIAALLVLTFHYDAAVQGPLQRHEGDWVSLPYAFIRAGDTGVSLFFVLSAFLLAMPFLAAADGGTPVAIRRYAQRRALRILPLYFVVVAAATAATATTLGDLVRGVPYLFFLNGLDPAVARMPPWSNVWWSLATEIQFYLALPLLPLALRSRRSRAIALAGLAVYAAAFLLYERWLIGFRHPPHNVLLGLSLFGRAPLFLCGIVAAAFYLRHGSSLRRRLAAMAWLRGGGADLLLFALLLGLALWMRWETFVGVGRLNAPPAHALRAAEGPLWSALVLWLLLAPLRLKPLLHNALLTRAGVLSYSIYLLHLPVLQYGQRALRAVGLTIPWGWSGRTAAVAAGLAAVCLVLSTATYRLIEAPFLRRKERLRS